MATVRPGEGCVPCNRRGPRWGENLPFGRASIASGYTPAAFAGQSSCPPKGVPAKSRILWGEEAQRTVSTSIRSQISIRRAVQETGRPFLLVAENRVQAGKYDAKKYKSFAQILHSRKQGIKALYYPKSTLSTNGKSRSASVPCVLLPLFFVLPVAAWKTGYANLTTERDTLN